MKLTVKTRIILSFGLLISILLALGFYSVTILKMVNGKTTEITDNWLPGVHRVDTISNLISNYRIREYRHIIANTNEEMNQMENDMINISKEIEKNFNDYEKTIADNYDRNLFNAVKLEYGKYIQMNQQVVQLSRQEKTEEAMDLMRNESKRSFDRASTVLSELIKYNQKNGDRASEESDKIYSGSRKMLMVVIGTAVLIAVMAAFLINRSIVKPLKQIEIVANQLAEGNLTGGDVIVKNQDEIRALAHSFNIMKNNLKEIMNKLAMNANSLSQTASDLSSQAGQTSVGASENAATMSEIASTVEQVTANVQQISMVSNATTEHANEGNKGIIKVTEQMQNIAKATSGVASVIESLNKTSKEINQIVELITNIADQTNLLALNAAIEAARAGEHGRGFAVVAEEVRKLAEQSANAAKDIKKLISAIQVESEKAVESMSESGRQVDTGTIVVQEVGHSFMEIINAVQGLTTQIQEVASATEQMSAGVQNVAASTEEQTAAMEEVAASADSLSKLADQLNAIVDKFKT